MTDFNSLWNWLKALIILNYKEVKDEEKSQFITDLAESFNDVKLHEAGKKKLKYGKDY